jgi:anti-sigma B factor antagonist
MELSSESLGSTTVIHVSGSVDSLTADALLAALQSHVDDGRVRLVCDLSAVEYTSSAGLRALLATLKATRQQGGDFRLAAVRPSVHRVLELSGFTSILKLYGDVDAAVESFVA